MILVSGGHYSSLTDSWPLMTELAQLTLNIVHTKNDIIAAKKLRSNVSPHNDNIIDGIVL